MTETSPSTTAADPAQPGAASGPAGSATPSHPALENPTRRRVYEHVRGRPGAPIADVAEAVDVSHSTATYHLDRLADADLVVALEDGNKLRFFPDGGAFTEEERVALAVLDDPGTRDVLRTLAVEGPSYRAALAEALGISTPTVNWHLDRLRRCGLLRERPDGRRRTLEVDGAAVLDLLEGVLGALRGRRTDVGPLRDLADALR